LILQDGGHSVANLLPVSEMTSSMDVTPKMHLIAWKHVVWAIKRENRSNSSTWAIDGEKAQDNW